MYTDGMLIAAKFAGLSLLAWVLIILIVVVVAAVVSRRRV